MLGRWTLKYLNLSKTSRSNIPVKNRYVGYTTRRCSSSSSNNNGTSTLDFKTNEKFWFQKWKTLNPSPQKNSTYPEKRQEKGKQKYILSMFPYPSGNLHMGHVRVYTISDSLARFHNMLGYDVIHPMGFDAFGLPAENAALERKTVPSSWTFSNIQTMRSQFDLFHAQFDWDRMVNTSDPKYYKYTQQIILDLYEAGLLYRKEAKVNWDPIDKTVLANEQVDKEGRSWRSGAIVEQKTLVQWYIKITEFAQELYQGLDGLELWPNKVKNMQRNWIGPNLGTNLQFPLSLDDQGMDRLEVFTTRVDTLPLVQFLAVGPNHQILNSMDQEALKGQLELYNRENVEGSLTGFPTGIEVVNPLTKAKVPVWVSNYVIEGYATASVMGVPQHDDRDAKFVQKYPQINQTDTQPNLALLSKSELELLNSLDNLEPEEVQTKLNAWLECNDLGKVTTQYKLRDWLISRQRYWGTPLPFIHCTHCGIQPVPKPQLPITLPPLTSSDQLLGSEGSPLANFTQWKHTTCPKCTKPALRDCDTMDTFVDSSWYFLKYLHPQDDGILLTEAEGRHMPVDIYIGGIEHAILHLLYSRFLARFLKRNENVLGWDGEPFKRLVTQGMVQGKTYKLPNGQFVRPDQIDLSNPNLPKHRSDSLPLTVSFQKMSKSKFNGVDPKETIDRYGVDATRLYILAQAAPEDDLDWDPHSIVGMQRFLNKIYKLVQFQRPTLNSSKPPIEPNEPLLEQIVQSTVQNTTYNLTSSFKLNVVVSDLIKLTNSLSEFQNKVGEKSYLDGCKTLVTLLAPLAPSSAELFYSKLTLHTKLESVFLEPWPKVTELGLKGGNQGQCIVQVNGKKRFSFPINSNLMKLDQNQLVELICKMEEGSRFLQGKVIKKVIQVKGNKLINFVV